MYNEKNIIKFFSAYLPYFFNYKNNHFTSQYTIVSNWDTFVFNNFKKKAIKIKPLDLILKTNKKTSF